MATQIRQNFSQPGRSTSGILHEALIGRAATSMIHTGHTIAAAVGG
jgi:hypothetical protein